MPTPSGLPTKTDFQNAQLDVAHAGRVFNSKDAQGNPITTSTNRTGGVNKTLDALEAEFQHAVDSAASFTDTANATFTTNDGQTKRSVSGIISDALEAIRNAGGQPIGDGTWQAGQTFTAYNQFMVYNGIAYKPLTTTTLPYGPTGATPDLAFVGPFSDVTDADITIAQGELIGGVVFPSSGDLAVGMTVPIGATHLRVDGAIYAMSPIATGSVTAVTSTSATIGGVMVSLEKTTTLTSELSNDRTSQLIAGTYQSSGFELVTDQHLSGQGRLSTIIESSSGAVISRSQTEETNDTNLSRVTLKGGGKGVAGTVGYDLRSPSGVQKSAIRNELDNVAIRDCEVGIASNSGWNNILKAYRVTDCGTGYKSSTSWVSGWGGSGNVSIGGYYAACNTGIDTTSQWNMCFINTIVEYCETPIYERGNNNTYINTWLEGNSNPVKVIRGSVFINGRGLDFDLSEITPSEPKETLALITNRGAKFARRDLAKPEFNVDGDGVTDIRTPVGGGAWQHFRTAFSGSGERSSIEQTTYTGTTTAQARTESVPVSSVKQLVSADTSNNLFGAVAFFAGKAASDGTPDVTHPFAEKWRVRYDGELRPAVDGLYDIASAGRRVDQIFLVNQPSVTSSRAYKTHEREIPEAVLRAVRKVPFKLFEYTDSIERKGGTYSQIGERGARTHVNPIIEDIIAAFESEGVDPWQFAVIRKVSWDSEPANYDDEGKLISEAIDAGERLELVEAQWLALKIASILQ